jgi:hypothetical protein
MTTEQADEDGQLVTIDGKLVYRWTGDEPVAVGDAVWLPGNWLKGNRPWVGEVTALGGDYDGTILDVLRRASDQDVY